MQKNQLAQLGVTDICEAENGQDALDVLKNNMPVDVVLLDWNMPVMDGMECLKAIKSDATLKATRVVMCTSESEKRKVIEAMKEGADNYIVKPFTPEILREKLQL
jgi:two-component system chemotaxis response regulator CheY